MCTGSFRQCQAMDQFEHFNNFLYLEPFNCDNKWALPCLKNITYKQFVYEYIYIYIYIKHNYQPTIDCPVAKAAG